MSLSRTLALALSCTLTLAASAANAVEAAWKPERTPEIVVPTAPGGGNDKTARTLQKVWQDMGLQTQVVNRTGGGGAVAYTYLSQRTADPHHIAIAQAGLFTNNITGKSPIQYTDFIVLANLGIEPSALAVRADHPIKSGKELFDRLKNDPQSVSISIGSTVGGTSHLALSRAYKAMGGDPKKLKTLSFNGSAESVTAVLGGHIDAMIAAINNVVPHVAAGKMRAVAVSSTNRLSGDFANVPTFRDLGMDVAQYGWTVILAPKGLTPAQIRYWEEMIAKAAETPTWKNYLATNHWIYTVQRSADATKYLAGQHELARRALVDLGMAKTATP